MNRWYMMVTAGFCLLGLQLAYANPVSPDGGAAAEGKRPEHLVSATYCSNAWVVNFWNSESSRMDEELTQIREDGFNSIILVLPWREFQPGMNPARYNSYAFEKLHQVMAAAARQELWVMLRLGYTWDYSGSDDILARYEALLYRQGSTRDAWLNYAKRVYEEVSPYRNFYGGFITWEDFWNFTDKAGRMGNGRDSVALAGRIGYQEYLESNYMLEAVRQIYQTELPSFEDIYLPARDEHAYLLFFRYYDEFLNDLLRQTQAVFPNLSMEVRLDIDPVSAEDGQGRIGVRHDATFACGGADFTAAMYGASMGFEAGQELTAEETVEELQQQLAAVRSYNGSKPIYLDQFLYMDETEEYRGNASLMNTERAEFLELSAPVLESMTMGYGIWTYRNYTNNAIYNAQFGLGTRGWTFADGSVAAQRKGSMMARLPDGSRLSQSFWELPKREYQVRLTADSDEPAELTVTLGGVSKTMPVDGKRQLQMNFGRINGKQISFESDGTIWLDDVNVFTYEQDGQLYGQDGQELSCLAAMRKLNAQVGSAIR